MKKFNYIFIFVAVLFLSLFLSDSINIKADDLKTFTITESKEIYFHRNNYYTSTYYKDNAFRDYYTDRDVAYLFNINDDVSNSIKSLNEIEIKYTTCADWWVFGCWESAPIIKKINYYDLITIKYGDDRNELKYYSNTINSVGFVSESLILKDDIINGLYDNFSPLNDKIIFSNLRNDSIDFDDYNYYFILENENRVPYSLVITISYTTFDDEIIDSAVCVGAGCLLKDETTLNDSVDSLIGWFNKISNFITTLTNFFIENHKIILIFLAVFVGLFLFSLLSPVFKIISAIIGVAFGFIESIIEFVLSIFGVNSFKDNNYK